MLGGGFVLRIGSGFGIGIGSRFFLARTLEVVDRFEVEILRLDGVGFGPWMGRRIINLSE